LLFLLICNNLLFIKELTAGIDIDDQSTFSLQQETLAQTESSSLIDLNSDVSTLGTLSTTESSSSSTTTSPSPLLYTSNRNSETVIYILRPYEHFRNV